LLPGKIGEHHLPGRDRPIEADQRNLCGAIRIFGETIVSFLFFVARALDGSTELHTEVVDAGDIFGIGGKFQEVVFIHFRQRHLVL